MPRVKMFSKSQIAFFALSILSASLGRPFDSETLINKPPMLRAQVTQTQAVRAQVVPRDASTSCAPCTTTTFTVSGTATASAVSTFFFGYAPTSTASPSAIGNFGSCSVPEIEFGVGFDDRNETSFRPVDQVSYNHTSAEDITVIIDFICSALVYTCGADSTAQATCARAQTAAAAQTPEQGIDADAFNQVFGIQTNFQDVEPLGNTGEPTAGSTDSSTTSSASSSPSAVTDSLNSTAATATVAASNSSSTHDAASHTVARQAPPTTLVTVARPTIESIEPAATSASAGSTNSNNLQSFTGALGGISAPAVVASGSRFQVENNSIFNSKADALSRSCDVQQNDCANAANAEGDKGSLTVAACQAQQNECDAASGA